MGTVSSSKDRVNFSTRAAFENWSMAHTARAHKRWTRILEQRIDDLEREREARSAARRRERRQQRQDWQKELAEARAATDASERITGPLIAEALVTDTFVPNDFVVGATPTHNASEVSSTRGNASNPTSRRASGSRRGTGGAGRSPKSRSPGHSGHATPLGKSPVASPSKRKARPARRSGLGMGSLTRALRTQSSSNTPKVTSGPEAVRDDTSSDEDVDIEAKLGGSRTNSNTGSRVTTAAELADLDALPVEDAVSYDVNRSTYVDIFLDYDVIQGGEYLSLPVGLFRRFDPSDCGLVDVRVIFILLALWCSGTVLDKVNFVFGMMSHNSTSLNFHEFSRIVEFLIVGHYCLGVNKRLPRKKEMKSTCVDMFNRADVNHDDSVSLPEFTAWAHVAITSKELLVRFHRPEGDPEPTATIKRGKKADKKALGRRKGPMSPPRRASLVAAEDILKRAEQKQADQNRKRQQSQVRHGHGAGPEPVSRLSVAAGTRGRKGDSGAAMGGLTGRKQSMSSISSADVRVGMSRASGAKDSKTRRRSIVQIKRRRSLADDASVSRSVVSQKPDSRGASHRRLNLLNDVMPENIKVDKTGRGHTVVRGESLIIDRHGAHAVPSPVARVGSLNRVASQKSFAVSPSGAAQSGFAFPPHASGGKARRDSVGSAAKARPREPSAASIGKVPRHPRKPARSTRRAHPPAARAAPPRPPHSVLSGVGGDEDEHAAAAANRARSTRSMLSEVAHQANNGISPVNFYKQRTQQSLLSQASGDSATLREDGASVNAPPPSVAPPASVGVPRLSSQRSVFGGGAGGARVATLERGESAMTLATHSEAGPPHDSITVGGPMALPPGRALDEEYAIVEEEDEASDGGAPGGGSKGVAGAHAAPPFSRATTVRMQTRLRMAAAAIPWLQHESSDESDHTDDGDLLMTADDPETRRFRAKFEARAKDVRNRKQRAIASKREQRWLHDNTKFNFLHLRSLTEQFTDVSNVTGHLERRSFHRVIKNTLPAFGAFERDRLFRIADKDRWNLLSFRRTVECLNMVMRGLPEEKLDLIFRIYDVNNTGFINTLDVVRFIKQGWRRHTVLVTKAIDLANSMMKLLDVDGDGEVTRAEFAVSIARDPQLLETFTQCIAINKEMARALHELTAVHPNFNKGSVSEMFRALGSGFREHLIREHSLEEFTQFMTKFFDCQEDEEEHVALIFEAFDTEENGRVVLRDILNGFVQIMGTSMREQTEYYFDLYDMNGDGTLDRNEIMHMLLSSQTKTNEDAAAVIDIINRFDPQGIGKISREKFNKLGFRDTIIMETLDHMFEIRVQVYDVFKMPSKRRAKRRRRSKARVRRRRSSTRPPSRPQTMAESIRGRHDRRSSMEEKEDEGNAEEVGGKDGEEAADWPGSPDEDDTAGEDWNLDDSESESEPEVVTESETDSTEDETESVMGKVDPVVSDAQELKRKLASEAAARRREERKLAKQRTRRSPKHARGTTRAPHAASPTNAGQSPSELQSGHGSVRASPTESPKMHSPMSRDATGASPSNAAASSSALASPTSHAGAASPSAAPGWPQAVDDAGSRVPLAASPPPPPGMAGTAGDAAVAEEVSDEDDSADDEESYEADGSDSDRELHAASKTAASLLVDVFRHATTVEENVVSEEETPEDSPVPDEAPRVAPVMPKHFSPVKKPRVKKVLTPAWKKAARADVKPKPETPQWVHTHNDIKVIRAQNHRVGLGRSQRRGSTHRAVMSTAADGAATLVPLTSEVLTAEDMTAAGTTGGSFWVLQEEASRCEAQIEVGGKVHHVTHSTHKPKFDFARPLADLSALLPTSRVPVGMSGTEYIRHLHGLDLLRRLPFATDARGGGGGR